MIRTLAGLAALGLAWLPDVVRAIEIRNYSAARHDRFTDFPTAPVWNDAAWFGSRKFSGVGWIPDGSDSRQFALVSPQHLVCALHYAPGVGTPIRFLSAQGSTVDRTVAGGSLILNSAGQATDLYLLRLSSPITSAEGVAPLPYLNLANESTYVGKVMTIFGWTARAGRGVVSSISDYAEAGAVNPTRALTFRYRKSTGNQDDGYVVVGDSGSPSFVMVDEVPALVGVHLAAGESDTHWTGIDTFVPHYQVELNAAMEAEGYQMIPADPPVVTLSASLATPSLLRQAASGNCTFAVANTGGTEAGNARVVFHFPQAYGPDSISASGWIVESSGAETWVLRRAKLAAGANAVFTLQWNKLPSTGSIAVKCSPAADGSPSGAQTFGISLSPSFAAWADGLLDAGEAGDPDGDGIPNLLEYALGGDPAVASPKSETGGVLLPELTIANGLAGFKFPVREDRMARGLTYGVESSTNLEAGSWSPVSEAAMSDETTAFDPPVAGFQLRSLSWGVGNPRRFYRLRVSLDE